MCMIGQTTYAINKQVALKTLVFKKAPDGLIHAFAKEFGTQIPGVDEIVEWADQTGMKYWLTWLVRHDYIQKVKFSLLPGSRFLTMDGRRVMFCYTGYRNRNGFFVDEDLGRRVTQTCSPGTSFFPGLPKGYDVNITSLLPLGEPQIETKSNGKHKAKTESGRRVIAECPFLF